MTSATSLSMSEVHLGPIAVGHSLSGSLLPCKVDCHLQIIYNGGGDFMDSGRSLMKTKKSKGQRTVPCGTPDVTWEVSDVAPSSTTSCFPSLSKDLSHFSVLLLIP